MKIYELLDKPEKWTQNHWAKDSNGNVAGSEESRPVCWCIWGACQTCYRDSLSFKTVWEKLNSKLIKKSPISWNDDPERKWEDVYNLCKELDI